MSYFADNLKKLRCNANITQKELASKLNVSQAAINFWENGKREPSFDTMIQISHIFHVDVHSLINEKNLDSKLNSGPSFMNDFSGDIKLEITEENLKKYRECFETAYYKVVTLMFQNHDKTLEWFDVKTGKKVTEEELENKFKNPTDEFLLNSLKTWVESIVINKALNTLSITYKLT